jgi:CHAT domain-containing protein
MNKWTIFPLILAIFLIATNLLANETKSDSFVESILRGDTFFQQGQAQQAITLWEQSLAQVDCNSYAEQCIDGLTRLATAYLAKEMHTNMFATLSQALSLVDQIKDVKRRALVYSQASDAWLFLGERLANWQPKLTQIEAWKSLSNHAEIPKNIPNYLKQALWFAEASVLEAKQAHLPTILANALNNQGNVLVALGKQLEKQEKIESAWQQYFDAIEAYQNSGLEAEKTDDETLVITPFLNELKVKLAGMMLSLPEILTEMKQLRQLIEKLPDREDKANFGLSFGLLGLELLQQDEFLSKERQNANQLLTEKDQLTPDEQQQFEEFLQEPGLTKPERQTMVYQTYSAFQDSARIAQVSSNAHILSMAYGYLGQLYETEQRYTEALKLTRQAIFFATQHSIPHTGSDAHQNGETYIPLVGHYSHVLYRWHWQHGRILQALGLDVDNIIAAYRLASQNLTPIQRFLENGYRLPVGLFEKAVKPIHYALADLLLQKAEQTTELQEQQLLLKEAMTTIESVKITELQDYLQDECVVALRAETHSILDYDKFAPKVQKELQNTAILYPIALADRLVLLVSIQGHISQLVVVPEAVTADKVQDTVKDTAWNLQIQLQTRPHNRFLWPAQQLYDWLIKPLEEEGQLKDIDTLVIVPDSNLRMVPFATLHDGQQFLIEKYAIAITPGLKLVAPQSLKWHDKKILLVGLSEARLAHSPLPNVAKELDNIACTTSNHFAKDILLNKDFSRTHFVESLKQNMYSVVHIATHGEFNADPKKTYLLTYHEKIRIGELQDAIGLGRFRSETPLDLLTLSACKTAVGDDRAALGLAGIAIQASAKSAIATLWFVDDEATSIAMSEFYQQLLKPGMSKAKALQETQKTLLKIKRYWHPSYWAPFLLIGNWL